MAGLVVFSVTWLVFLIVLLVNNGVITNVYFSHISGSGDVTYVAIGGMHPAYVSCAASFVYALACALWLQYKALVPSIYLFKSADALFFSFLLCALVHFDDVLHLFLLVCVYVCLHMLILDATHKPVLFTLSKCFKLTLAVLFFSFYTSLWTGVVMNFNVNRPGGAIAQLFSSIVAISDLQHIYGISSIEGYNGKQETRIYFEMAIRFIVLICAFVETV